MSRPKINGDIRVLLDRVVTANLRSLKIPNTQYNRRVTYQEMVRACNDAAEELKHTERKYP